MYKYFAVGIAAILLITGCGDQEAEPVNEEPATIEEEAPGETEPTQEELNAQLKEEAVQADIVEINVENPPVGKKVFTEGEVSLLESDSVVKEFYLNTTEGSGHGRYKISLINTDTELEEGDKVRIYGAVNEKAEDGTAQITATIIERVE